MYRLKMGTRGPQKPMGAGGAASRPSKCNERSPAKTQFRELTALATAVNKHGEDATSLQEQATCRAPPALWAGVQKSEDEAGVNQGTGEQAEDTTHQQFL